MRNVFEAPEIISVPKNSKRNIIGQAVLGVDSVLQNVRAKGLLGGGGNKDNSTSGSDSDDLTETLLKWLPGRKLTDSPPSKLSDLGETLLKWLPGRKDSSSGNGSDSSGSDSG